MTQPSTYLCCKDDARIAVIVVHDHWALARLIADHRVVGTPVLDVSDLDAPLPVTMPHHDRYAYVRLTGPFSAPITPGGFRRGPVGVVVDARRALPPTRKRVATIADELQCHAAVALQKLPPSQSAHDPDWAGRAQIAHPNPLSGWNLRDGHWHVEVVGGDRSTVSVDLRGDGERVVLTPQWPGVRR